MSMGMYIFCCVHFTIGNWKQSKYNESYEAGEDLLQETDIIFFSIYYIIRTTYRAHISRTDETIVSPRAANVLITVKAIFPLGITVDNYCQILVTICSCYGEYFPTKTMPRGSLGELRVRISNMCTNSLFPLAT